MCQARAMQNQATGKLLCNHVQCSAVLSWQCQFIRWSESGSVHITGYNRAEPMLQTHKHCLVDVRNFFYWMWYACLLQQIPATL